MTKAKDCRLCPCRPTDEPPDDEPCDCACHLSPDAFMDQPVSEEEREAIARKHRAE